MPYEEEMKGPASPRWGSGEGRATPGLSRTRPLARNKLPRRNCQTSEASPGETAIQRSGTPLSTSAAVTEAARRSAAIWVV